MAFLCSRLLSRNLRRQIPVANRFYADYQETPTPSELSTGLEKKEMEMLEAGNEDPFRMRAVKRHPSSKTNPNIVESYYDCRIVGCICEEDSGSVMWMWLFKGEPKRCMCGHWFKLVEYKPF